MNPNLMTSSSAFAGKSYASEYIRSAILRIQTENSSVSEIKPRRSVLFDTPAPRQSENRFETITPSAPVEFDKSAYTKNLLLSYGETADPQSGLSKSSSGPVTVNHDYDSEFQAKILDSQTKADIAEAQSQVEKANNEIADNEIVKVETKPPPKKRKVPKGKGKRKSTSNKSIKGDICSSPGSSNRSDEDDE